jgi:putative exporter of polyketide antibiotics
VEDGRPQRERAVNQVLGLRLPLGRDRVQSYIEARWTELNRETVFRLVFGLNLNLFRY